jgi:hypothetical protein
MTIGAGIAIAGIWGFVGACALSRTVTGVGMGMAMAVAIIATTVVAMH